MKRDVGAELDVEITAPTTLEFQIAVAPQPGAEVTESLTFVLDGKEIPLADIREIAGDHGNRIHTFEAPVGNLKVRYSATVVGEADPAPLRDIDMSTYLRPSRYAEADKFYGFAATEFGEFADSATLLEKVSSGVGTRLSYVPGSSDPIDGAADTVLAGAFVEGQWRVVDATCLAPRQSMVRIATGRDAADTAFLDNHKGAITLNNMTVTATVDGDLPRDSLDQLVSIR